MNKLESKEPSAREQEIAVEQNEPKAQQGQSKATQPAQHSHPVKRPQETPSGTDPETSVDNGKRQDHQKITDWIMAISTVFILLATAVNVIVAWLQWDVAKTAANAAKSAADTADKTFKIDQRPYLVAQIPQFVEPLSPRKTAKANVTIKNIGRTPAIKQKMFIKLLPYRVQERKDQFVSFLEGAYADLKKQDTDGGEFAGLARKDIAPEATAFSTAVTQSTLSPIEIRAIKEGPTLVLFYVGIIRYTDAFDVGYETEFCYFFHGKDPRTWHICDAHNTIK